MLQGRAVERGGERRAHRLECRDDAFDGLAISRVGHRLAVAAMAAVGQLGEHDDRFGAGAARNGERARDGPMLDAGFEDERHWVE